MTSQVVRNQANLYATPLERECVGACHRRDRMNLTLRIENSDGQRTERPEPEIDRPHPPFAGVSLTAIPKIAESQRSTNRWATLASGITRKKRKLRLPS